MASNRKGLEMTTAQILTILYSLLICMGGGTLAFLGIAGFFGKAPKATKIAAIVAAVLLLAGICCFAGSLGKPQAIMKVASNVFKGAPKSVEFVTAICCFVVGVVFFVMMQREVEGIGLKIVAVVAVLFGIAMGITAGMSGSVGRPDWVKTLLPFAYLGNALLMGGALFVGLMAVLKETEGLFKKFFIVLVAVAAVQLVCFIAYGIGYGFNFDALLYWGCAIVIGTVVAGGLLALAPKAQAIVFATAACSLVGGFFIRAIVVTLGSASLNLIARAVSHSSAIG